MRARVTGGFKATARGERIDWQAVRDTIVWPTWRPGCLARPRAAAGSDRLAASGGSARSMRIRTPHSASSPMAANGDAGDAG